MTTATAADLQERIRRLSPRQIECLRLVYERRTSKEIALEIGLSSTTVDSYITDAITLLQSRNRRHAAELLHHAHIPGSIPEKFGSRSSGDEVSVYPIQAPLQRPARWFGRMPVRQTGAYGNDLSPLDRLIFIPLIAVLFAIGFGALANGARTISDLFAAWVR